MNSIPLETDERDVEMIKNNFAKFSECITRLALRHVNQPRRGADNQIFCTCLQINTKNMVSCFFGGSWFNEKIHHALSENEKLQVRD